MNSRLAGYSKDMSRITGTVCLSLCAVALLLFLPPVVSGQSRDDGYAFIIYAEGYDVSIYRNGELTTYDVLVDDVLGMPLLAGDMIQTDADTFLEIQVMPARTVIKVAENTTFEIERIGGTGGGTFNMTYGRLRARVERATQTDPFEVRGFSAVAGVRGTDFGYDSVVERKQLGELRTRVYVFEGEVDVSDRPAPELEEEPQVVRLASNQMVNVVTEVPERVLPRVEDPDAPLLPDDPEADPRPVVTPARRVVFEQQEIEPEVQEFWTREDFREDPLDPDRVDERFPGINARVQQLTEERLRYEELQRLRREGLLSDPDLFLAETEEVLELPREREPVQVTLDGPSSSDRARRLILPPDETTLGRQMRLAGHWFMGLGIALEVAGIATAWYGEGYRELADLEGGGPSAGLMTGGGVFITSGLISYLVSLFAD